MLLLESDDNINTLCGEKFHNFSKAQSKGYRAWFETVEYGLIQL